MFNGAWKQPNDGLGELIKNTAIYMNTTAKGNELENEVYNYLNKIIDTSGGLIRIRRHEKYNDIVADISVETYCTQEFLDKKQPSIVTIYECKNLKRRLDKSDFHEWIGKLKSFGTTGHKLYFVTRNDFPEPIIVNARKENIGLIKFPCGASSFDYVTPRTVINKFGYNEYLEILMGKGDSSNEIYCYDNNSIIPFSDLLLNNGIPIKQKYLLEIPLLRNIELEKYVENLISKCGWSLNILNKLCEDYHIIVSTKKMQYGRLGYLDIQTSNIFISEEIAKNEKRYRFVLAHELGHFFLHRVHLIKKISAFYEDEESLRNISLCGQQAKIMEQQANKFASYLLLPKDQIVQEFFSLFEFRGLKGTVFNVDDQECNLGDSSFIVSRLHQVFKVSKQVITYRLMDLNLMKITDKAKSILGL